jgi:hypothetical protein
VCVILFVSQKLQTVFIRQNFEFVADEHSTEKINAESKLLNETHGQVATDSDDDMLQHVYSCEQ